MFGRRQDAGHELAALAGPDARAAVLLDVEGERFAWFARGGAPALDPALVREGEQAAGPGTVVRPVLCGSELIGTRAVAFEDGRTGSWIVARAATLALCAGLALASLAHLHR